MFDIVLDTLLLFNKFAPKSRLEKVMSHPCGSIRMIILFLNPSYFLGLAILRR